jgi:hypothetical protein
MGVRAVETMTASGMGTSWVVTCHNVSKVESSEQEDGRSVDASTRKTGVSGGAVKTVVVGRVTVTVKA